ncbi:phospholipase D family protein [Pseudomonas sp. GM21]|uniref:phospholipase D family protein n=1 Tax=Pseudomonas sp. GM21 TaxID=1144325 RepID=UPI0006ACADE7|nr:phospholipase D family protein [Pseudomonas sp. GM21]
MKIVTNVRKSKSHLTVLRNIFGLYDDIVICSGWMKMCGLAEILPMIDGAISRGAKVAIYTNTLHAEVGCVAALQARPGLTHLNVETPYLHTKLFYGRKGDSFIAMVGSANITAGGLWKNEELSVVLFGKTSDAIHSQYAAYIKKLSLLMAS